MVVCALSSPASAAPSTPLGAPLLSALQPGEALAPAGLEGQARFGSAVALSADGTTALVRAPFDGEHGNSVVVFTRSGSSWEQGPLLAAAQPGSEGEEEPVCPETPGECRVGTAVALSADGGVALIGAPRQDNHRGAVWVFVRSGGVWTALEQLTAGPEEHGAGRFGASVSISADGQSVLVGAPGDEVDRGSAWVFTRTPAGYVEQGPKLAGLGQAGEGYFGRSVALSADGSTAIVGSPADEGHAGSATAYARTGGAWAQQAKLSGAGEAGEGRFGFSVALSADGSTALLGGRTDDKGAGAAWVFRRSGGEWAQQGPKLTAPEETSPGRFGWSVALSADGNSALLGAPRDGLGTGAAWLFDRSGEAWAPAGPKLHGAESGGEFGWSVALAADGGTALVGAPQEDESAGDAWSFLGTPLTLPAVASVSPGSGPATGGTPVTITGSGFLPGATVRIGSAATSVQVISETEIKAVTAASPAGSAEVLVSDAYGTSSAGPRFTFTAAGGSTTTGTVTNVVTPKGGALSSNSSQLPAPKLGVSGNLFPAGGTVRVKLPGSSRWVLLSQAQQVPFGTIVDARNGTVNVTTTGAHGETQTATFFAGEFKLTQSRNGTASAQLVGGDFSSCPTRSHKGHKASAQAAARRKPKRKLWGQVHGSYSTKGNYATGAALGTRWLTEDFCEGTLIVVTSHRVRVTNLVNHHQQLVVAGHRYFAKAP